MPIKMRTSGGSKKKKPSRNPGGRMIKSGGTSSTVPKTKQREGIRPRDPEISDSEVTKILRPLKQAAEKRERLKEEYKELVLECQLAAIDASTKGIPLRLIVEAGLFTRQYFYQIERDYKAGKIGNANGKAKLGAPKHKTLAEMEEDTKTKSNPMIGKSRKKVRIR